MSRETIEELSKFIMNPALTYRHSLRMVAKLREGETLALDPSHPFPLSLEMSAFQSAGSLLKIETFIQKNAPNLATSWEDLFRHMSDKDYYDIYALPAEGEFTMVIPLATVLNKLVMDEVRGYRRLVIPRETKITVADMTFRTVYPIEIRQFSHGEISVVYDADISSPLQVIPSNIIRHQIVRSYESGMDTLLFTFKAVQYDIKSTTKTVTPGTQVNVVQEVDDSFYLARVFHKPLDGDGQWVEIPTTYSEQVYDPYNPTAVIKAMGNQIRMMIPQIYTTNNRVLGQVRFDIYQTRGPVYTELGSFNRGDFNYEFKPIDKNEITDFVRPLFTIQEMAFYSTDFVIGGRAPLTFQQVRDRVVRNATGPKDKPITPDQMKTVLEDKGYEIIKKIDPVTDRVMLATRHLPKPTQEKLITAASLSIQTGFFNAQSLVDLGTVIDNGTSMTILPETVYQNRDGRLYFVSKRTVESIQNLTKNAQSQLVTAGNYYYSPFHYVLDMNDDRFTARPYYLQEPMANSQSYVSSNDTTNLSIATNGYNIRKTARGYVLEVSTRSNDAARALLDHEVFAQLAFRPVGENSVAYLNGTMIGRGEDNEYVFQFEIDSNFNVRSNDALELTNFKMFDNAPRRLGVNLTDDFHVLYATSHEMDTNYRPNEVDSFLGKMYLPNQIAGIMHEKLSVTFGQSLKYLWARSRTIVEQEKYERYLTDIPAYYEEDVVQPFPDGSTMKVENGVITYAPVIHRKGDPKMIDGVQVIAHRKGEIRKDAMDNPIPLSPRALMRQVDFMLVDGVYWFSDDPVVADYRGELARTLVKWITQDIAELAPRLLEKTKLYFYPKTTTGKVEVMHGAGLVVKINATQGFTVTLSVSDRVYRDTQLRNAIEVMTITDAESHLSRQIVAMSNVIQTLKRDYERDVEDVAISGLGGDKLNYPIVTILNDTERLSLRKRLVVRSDDRLVVEEDITFIWVRHELDPR